MKERETGSTESENKSFLTRTLGYAHRLREETGYILAAVKERAVLGCGGILGGMFMAGVGGYILSRGLGYDLPWNVVGTVAGGAAILSGLTAIILSCDSEKSSY